MFHYKQNDYVDEIVNTEKIDLDYNFNIHPISGDITKVTNVEAIKMALKNLVLLNHYEKPFHPDIGSDIYKSMFELIDMPGTEIMLKNYIRDIITKFEPRAKLEDLKVNVQDAYNNVEITIYFTPVNATDTVSLTMYLQIIR